MEKENKEVNREELIKKLKAIRDSLSKLDPDNLADPEKLKKMREEDLKRIGIDPNS